MCPSLHTREFHLSSPTSSLEEALATYRPGPAESPLTSAKAQALLTHMVSYGSKHLPTLEKVVILSAGMRSIVLEVSGSGQAVVVKHFRRRDSASNSGGFGYLREKHGLPALNQLVPGSYPSLLSYNDAARLLVIEKIPGTSLLSQLHSLTHLPQQAQDAVLKRHLTTWVDFHSALLTSPTQHTAQASFTTALAQADPQAPTPGSLTSPRLAHKGLAVLARTHKLDHPTLTTWQHSIESILKPKPQDLRLTPGDYSPANLLTKNQDHPRGIDAEGTAITHWALPLAELLLGFPSTPGPPLPQELTTSTTWQEATHLLYRQINPPKPAPSPQEDPRVDAAVLTLQAILAEQTHKHRPVPHTQRSGQTQAQHSTR